MTNRYFNTDNFRNQVRKPSIGGYNSSTFRMHIEKFSKFSYGSKIDELREM